MPRSHKSINTSSRTTSRIEKIKRVLSNRTSDITVVLENVNDPHNLSAVLRSCDAIGILRVHLLYYGKQPIPKISETSSASAAKWIYTEFHDSVKKCFELLRSEGKKIYTTNMSQPAVSLYELDLTKPVAFVFGNEHDGVSDEAFEFSDCNFLIPQVGMIQCLNISVAAAVTLYEAFRQRIEAGFYSEQQLDDERINRLMNEWLEK